MNLDIFTKEELLDAIQLLGDNKYLNLMSNEELLKYNEGWTIDDVNNLKIQRFKCNLQFYKTGINAYLTLLGLDSENTI